VRQDHAGPAEIYWRDSGLLHHLMGVNDLEQLFSQPWVGHSWEGFVIEEVVSALAATGKPAQAFYFRTSDGYELDLVLERGVERWAIEVKLTSDPSTDMIDRLHRTANLIDASHRFLVCRIARKIQNDVLLVTNLSGMLKRLLAR
jgi:uncharacterized protein